MNSETAREQLVDNFGVQLVAEQEQAMLRCRERTAATVREATHYNDNCVYRVVSRNDVARLVHIPVALRATDRLPF